MVRQRPTLAGGFADASRRLQMMPSSEVEAWAEAVLGLANVNAGPSVLLVAFRLAAGARDTTGFARLAPALAATADICRRAGAGAARLCLNAYRDLDLAAADGPERAWWQGLVRLAEAAPGCLAAAVGSSRRILRICGALGFASFVDAALRATSDDGRRERFFGLQDPQARRILDRLSGQACTFAVLQPRLQAYATALWGRPFLLREMPPRAVERPRRASVSAGLLYLPDVVEVRRDRAERLYEASVAHGTAHLLFGGPPFVPGKLKPVQIALVGLIEDARVEALALRRLPGLFRLWAPFHDVAPSHLKTAPHLLARLSRALLDPTYADDDGIVSKGRALFAAEPDLADPSLSRRLGDVLGNDIGQMRIQFDGRHHVIEPSYRDDNLGLWRLPPPPDADTPPLDAPVNVARLERKEQDGGRADPDPDRNEQGAGRLRLVDPDDRGLAVARYPEWDRSAGIERPDWTVIRAVVPPLGDTAALDEALIHQAGLSRRVAQLVRAARVGLPTRLRRQPDGSDLDLDAAVEAATALRIGIPLEDRIHQRRVQRSRDLAVLVLVDVSESTGDGVPAAHASVLAVEKVAVAMLARAMAALGDNFALRAFASDGREDVRYFAIKDFAAPFDAEARARLAGLRPGLSTRLGAALRHAGAELGTVAATRRIVLVLTDGEPSDVDVADADDLIEDARHAILGLRRGGIDVFGITLDPNGRGAGATTFGRFHHMPVSRIEDLPDRLASLYFRIARR